MDLRALKLPRKARLSTELDQVLLVAFGPADSSLINFTGFIRRVMLGIISFKAEVNCRVSKLLQVPLKGSIIVPNDGSTFVGNTLNTERQLRIQAINL